jgi:hypothetical protein
VVSTPTSALKQNLRAVSFQRVAEPSEESFVGKLEKSCSWPHCAKSPFASALVSVFIGIQKKELAAAAAAAAAAYHAHSAFCAATLSSCFSAAPNAMPMLQLASKQPCT